MIAALEQNPHKPTLSLTSPLMGWMSCAADHAPKFPADVRKAVHKIEASQASGKHGKVDKKALERLKEWFVVDSAKDGVLPPRMGGSMLATTQAVDIINGGVKVNALVSQAQNPYMFRKRTRWADRGFNSLKS